MTATSTATRSRISTSGCSEQERLAVLHDCYARAVLKAELKIMDEGPVRFDATLRRLPGLTISSIDCSGLVMRRTPAAADPDHLVLTVTLAGGRHACQRGRETTVREGDALLASGDTGVATIFPGSRYLSLTMPTKAIAPLVADLDDHVLRPIPCRTEPLRLLMSYLGTLQDAHELATPDMQRVVAGHIHDLAALAIGASCGLDVAKLRGVRAARLRAIKADIADNLASELSASALASRHRVSLRYLQMLFESEGATVTGYVTEQRLAGAYRMLVDPRLADRTVGAIAFDVGFGDLSYFNRTFRQRFGDTPTGIRAQARQIN
jgi:AraC-like DNA-binding protein